MPHEDQVALSQLAGYGIRRAGVLSLLTNAQVVAATTAEDLVVNVEGAAVHEDLRMQKQQVIRAIRRAAALGDLTDALIQAATTVEGLAQLTSASLNPNTTYLGPGLIE